MTAIIIITATLSKMPLRILKYFNSIIILTALTDIYPSPANRKASVCFALVNDNHKVSIEVVTAQFHYVVIVTQVPAETAD